MSRLVVAALHQFGFTAEAFPSGANVMRRLQTERPDLCVIDLGLPDMDGMDLAYQITEMSSISVLILTGRGHTVDRVMGLELGGDDYVVKPFEARELVARVRRILRRRASTPGVAPQARERSAKPQDHQDGLWCRLPVFGCGDLVVIETWVRTNPRTCASHLVRARRMPQSLSQRGSDEATR